MRIIVAVKYVPDTAEEMGFDPDHRLVRDPDCGLLSELDEYAVEQALRLRDQLPDSTVTAVVIGPDDATAALRKALQMGADDATLVVDDQVAGSDVFATADLLAAGVNSFGDVGVVVCGMASTDAGTSAVPALVAARLGWPGLTHASHVEVSAGQVTIGRTDETGTRTATASLPVVISVTDQTDEPRYPSFKDVLAAKRKKIAELDLDDLDVDPATVGAGAARVQVGAIARNPDRAAGRTLTDTDGNTAGELVAFLTETLH
jgi:electron transfer flavoprotein beta subunit